MANHVSHTIGLGYVVKGARYTVPVPYLDADGDATDPTTPDTERSLDGAAFADCTEKVTTISGSNGYGYLTLTGDETNCSLLCVAAKVASGPKTTLLDAVPRVLPTLYSGTAQAGSASSITLATDIPGIANLLIGAIVKTTGGTGGGGGSGSLNNQARVISAFTSGRVATVVPDWETAPDATTTYQILLTDNCLFRLVDIGLISGDSTAADNLESAFDGTGYAGGTAKQDVNVVSISGDTTAADRLEALMDACRADTAQAGSASTITLDASASATNDFYNGWMILLTGGTGAGQSPRLISDYDGTTKAAAVTPNWTTAPDNTSTFILWPLARVDVGAWFGTVVPGVDTAGYPRCTLKDGTGAGEVDLDTGKVKLQDGAITAAVFATDAITADAMAADAGAEFAASVNSMSLTGEVDDGTPTASDFNGDASLSGTDNFYRYSYLAFTSGTNKGIWRKITGYTGATKNFQFAVPFPAAPADNDIFEIAAYGGA